jgi:hypothetical protein
MLFLITLAHAADAELGIGVGTLPHNTGPGDSLGFDFQNMMTEVYGTIPIHENVAVALALGHGSVSESIGFGGDYDYDSSAETSPFSSEIGTRTWSTGLRAGVRGSLDVARWYVPYATVQGVVLHQHLQVDDDLDVDDNLTQVSASGFTGGVAGALGSTIRIRFGGQPHLGLSAELGYTWLAPAQIGDVATVKLDGVTGRVGASYIF